MKLLRAILITLLFIAPALALAQGPYRPNDPEFDNQYALTLIGATCAWQRTLGSADVTVAVVDSGVDLGHPDLVDRLRGNGRDFVDGDDEPADLNGHGTHIAGIIAATIDNAQGVTGLAPGVSILPIRVMNRRGKGSDVAIASGIRYAADAGARVINLSLGATLMVSAETESRRVTDAIRYAQERGALVVVAAGNDFLPLPNAIVGDNPDVLVVAATGPDDRLASFSNYGSWISVTSPGVRILSTTPTYEVYMTSEEVPEGERFANWYDYLSGTSQAAPFVSALAALLFSAHPDWDARQVAATIRETAASIARRNQALSAEGQLSAGRIDACGALDSAQIFGPRATDAPLPVGESPGATPAAAPTGVPGGALASGISGGLLGPIAALLGGSALLAMLLALGPIRGQRRRAPPPGTRRAPSQAYPVLSVAPAASHHWGRLTVVGGLARRASYPLGGPAVAIGRAPDCAATLVGDPSVSRRHATVLHDGRVVTIEDAGSTHGTLLNGQPVTRPMLVRRGDVVQVGQTLLRFE